MKKILFIMMLMFMSVSMDADSQLNLEEAISMVAGDEVIEYYILDYSPETITVNARTGACGCWGVYIIETLG